MKINVNLDHLRAAYHFTPVKDVRYYLCGVCVEAMPKETRCIATTGAILATFLYETENEVEKQVQVIVPSEVVKAIKKPLNSGAINATLEVLTYDEATKRPDKCSLTFADGSSVTFKACEGRYPDSRRILHGSTKVEGTPAHIDFALYTPFVAMCKTLGFKTQTMYMLQSAHGNCHVGVIGQPWFAGVIMPMRMDEKLCTTIDACFLEEASK